MIDLAAALLRIEIEKCTNRKELDMQINTKLPW